MEDYKPNSFKSKEPQRTVEEPRKVEKVVTGPVKVKKKTGIGKFFSSFFADDMAKVKDYVVNDVLIPNMKKSFTDIVKNSIDMVVYGSDARGRNNVNNPVTKISYRNYSSYANPNPGFRRPETRTTYSYDELIFATKGEAEMVLNEMDEIIAKYGLVKVADYYDLAGTAGTYTDNNYGWMDIRSARVVRLPNGEYTIQLPRAVPID